MSTTRSLSLNVTVELSVEQTDGTPLSPEVVLMIEEIIAQAILADNPLGDGG